jgi:predicted ArsR family transcriptional regulator
MSNVASDTDLFVEHLVNTLAECEPATSQALADKLQLPVLVVRSQLVKLEAYGIVYRTGQTRGTLWWLG